MVHKASQQRHKILLACFTVFIFLFSTGCTKESIQVQGYHISDLVGVPTDYSEESNWAHLPSSVQYDVDTFSFKK